MDAMKILVANLGSTSFKYRLFDMAENRQLARGAIERIGSPESECPQSKCTVEIDGRNIRFGALLVSNRRFLPRAGAI